VIAAQCPEQPDATSCAVVIANVPERMPYHATGYPLHEVVQPDPDSVADHRDLRPFPLPDPAAVAWLAMSTPDQFVAWSERAAIMEHEGGLPKRHAEVLALGYLFEHVQQQRVAAMAQPLGGVVLI